MDRLICAPFSLLLILASPLAFAEVNELHYYKKEADIQGILEISRELFDVEGTVIDLPSTYYNENNLSVNAILCGEGVADEEALALLDALVELGVTVQYFGGYYSAERAALEPTLDIRSYGDVEFHDSRLGLDRNILLENDLEDFCGLKIGVIGPKR